LYTYSVEVDGEEIDWSTKEPFTFDLQYTDIIDEITLKLLENGHITDDVMIEDEGLIMTEIDGVWYQVNDDFQIVE